MFAKVSCFAIVVRASRRSLRLLGSHGDFTTNGSVPLPIRSYVFGRLPLFPDLFDLIGADEAVQARAGGDDRGIDVFVGDLNVVARPARDRRFEPLLVVFLELVAPGFGFLPPRGGLGRLQAGHGERRLVVSAATFVALQG